MNTGWSVGTNGVAITMLRPVIEFIAELLASVLNKYIWSGHFPSVLKKFLINCSYFQEFKRGDERLFENYRPSSFLSPFSKPIEYFVKKQIMKFFNKLKFFSNRQYGFLKGSLTEIAFAHYIERNVNSLESDLRVLPVYLHMRKAFDTGTVKHGIMVINY